MHEPFAAALVREPTIETAALYVEDTRRSLIRDRVVADLTGCSVRFVLL